MNDSSSPDAAVGFGAVLNRRVLEFRKSHPEIHGIDIDCLFVSFLLETATFGVSRYGPVSIDVDLVEEMYLRSLAETVHDGPHRFGASARAFYERLGRETEKTGARRPNELHYLLAFMRSPEGLVSRVFGELGVAPEAVEKFARQERIRTTAGWGQERPDSLLTPEEVAQKLSVNEQTVRAWIRSGKLPAVRLAGRKVLRIRESDIESVLEPVDPSDFK